MADECRRPRTPNCLQWGSLCTDLAKVPGSPAPLPGSLLMLFLLNPRL